MKKVLFLAFLALISFQSAPAAKVENGEDVIRLMHQKYQGKWYKTLTFVQKNTQWARDGSQTNSIWYEAMSLPGKLRIDFDPLDSGNGLMFVDSTQITFRDGKLSNSVPRVHDLMVLGFDVYGQEVAKTISQLKELKYDLSVLSENTWEERPVWVVGATKEDGKSPQFWIDKEHLYFVKLIRPAGPNGEAVQETRFNKYFKVKGGGWVSPEVEFLSNGRRVFLEEYSDVRTDVKLNDALFDPEKWSEVDKTYFKVK